MARIVLSAGGTGGHLFPAEALAEELLSRGHTVAIITDKRGHAFKSLGDRAAVYTVRAATLKPGVASKIKAIFEMGAGIFDATRLLMKIKPDIVVGFGGYPSFPGVFAGQALWLKTMLHEQNAVLGKANIWLAGRADAIAQSFPATRSIKPRDMRKCTVTGNPVRKAVVAVREIPYAAPAGTFRILITGGSQAAGIFADIVPLAAGRLPAELKNRLEIMHQAREADIARTAAAYETAGVKAEIKPFFSDMAERLSACHLFIGRSGASSVAEIAVAGRPAIFVPLRHADMQQKHNAEVVTKAGGGWLIMQENFTPETLAAELADVIKNPDLLVKAATCAKNCGQPDAAARLADMVEKTVKGR